MKTQRHLVPLGDEQQDRLRDALLDRGEDEVSDLLGVSRIALLRGAAGLGVMRGTHALIVRGLDEFAVESDGEDGDPADDADDGEDEAQDDEDADEGEDEDEDEDDEADDG